MIGIKYRIKRQEVEKDFNKSKFFGAPFFPEGLVETLDEDDVFICQINLEDIEHFNCALPKRGYLYFFINVSSYQYEGKVFYVDYTSSIKNDFVVIDDINDDFLDDYQIPSPMHMEFYRIDNDSQKEFSWEDFDIQLFGECPDFIEEEYRLEGYRCLLMIDTMGVDIFPSFGSLDGYILFMIKEEDLINQNFNNILLITWDS